MNEALKKLISISGGQTKLAKLCGVTQKHVHYWLKKRIPAERVIMLEKISNGRVKRHELRPDIYPPPDDGNVTGED